MLSWRNDGKWRTQYPKGWQSCWSFGGNGLLAFFWRPDWQKQCFQLVFSSFREDCPKIWWLCPAARLFLHRVASHGSHSWRDEVFGMELSSSRQTSWTLYSCKCCPFHHGRPWLDTRICPCSTERIKPLQTEILPFWHSGMEALTCLQRCCANICCS